MTQKKVKSKISNVKRNNQTRTKLVKQGKLKSRRNRQAKKQIQKPGSSVPKRHEEENEEESESDHGEDMMQMVEKDDLEFLKKSIADQSYGILKQIRTSSSSQSKQRRKRTRADEDDELEESYANRQTTGEETGLKRRMLLPIKTHEGFVERRMAQVEEEEEEEEEFEAEERSELEQLSNNAEEDEVEYELQAEDNLQWDTDKPLSTAELLARREEMLRLRRFKIGILSSSLLENPELKCGNFKVLLELMDESNAAVYLSVRKLAAVSLLEVFKDLLPAYRIKQISQEGVKLKKDTLQLQGYEATLLRSYKHYLQKLEAFAGVLRRKRGDTRKLEEQDIRLGEVAVNCLCDLLVTHPYFNYSVNIADLVVPFLDCKYPAVRATAVQCITQVFREDKRGELSLQIVRRINRSVKLHSHSVHSEMLSVLLALRIKDVDLDREKDEDLKQKKLMTRKQRLLALSKRERKRSKRLEEVEKEMMETKAEENKRSKQQVLTDITSTVFTIYFRILKQAPNSKILSVTLEGLAKFAPCINFDFYRDLVNVLNQLMEDGNLGLTEQLHCVETVFTILSGQGGAVNVDPNRFYSHLYKNLLQVDCGKSQKATAIVLRILVEGLVARRKRISQNRLRAFVKRVAGMSLHLQHNGTLGALGVITTTMRLGKAADILLDTDSTTGDGAYQAELEEPEHCNAQCTALWELIALQRHYHPTVQKLAKHVAWGVPTSGEGSVPAELAKLSPEELYNEFDPTGVAFKPAIPVPKNVKAKKLTGDDSAKRLKDFLNTCSKKIQTLQNGSVNFHDAWKSRVTS